MPSTLTTQMGQYSQTPTVHGQSTAWKYLLPLQSTHLMRTAQNRGRYGHRDGTMTWWPIVMGFGCRALCAALGPSGLAAWGCTCSGLQHGLPRSIRSGGPSCGRYAA